MFARSREQLGAGWTIAPAPALDSQRRTASLAFTSFCSPVPRLCSFRSNIVRFAWVTRATGGAPKAVCETRAAADHAFRSIEDAVIVPDLMA